MLARYFGKNRVQPLTLKEMIVGGIILALPCGLILLEPDVGSVLTYLPILAVVLFLSAIRLRLVIAAAALAVVMIPAAYWMGVKTGYVKAVPAGTHQRDPRSGECRSARHRLSHVAIDSDCRRRRADRFALVSRTLAERIEVSARAAHGFHLRRDWRKTRVSSGVCWCCLLTSS